MSTLTLRPSVLHLACHVSACLVCHVSMLYVVCAGGAGTGTGTGKPASAPLVLTRNSVALCRLTTAHLFCTTAECAGRVHYDSVDAAR